MNKRLFGGVQPFKKYVIEKMLTVLRVVYKEHPHYQFDDDEAKSKLLIDAAYANIRFDGKMPRFVVKIGAYNKDLSDTFSRNFSEATMSGESITGTKHRKVISLPITILVHGRTEEESSDLADELADVGIIFAYATFAKVGIIMNGVHVSETDIFNEEQTIYQTSVVFTVDVPWSYHITSNKKIDGVEVEWNVDRNEMENCGCKPEVGIYGNEYRQPGIEKYQAFIRSKE